jgi:phospholipid/cholesterol/gamma-HCH transport system substrate-binding protein
MRVGRILVGLALIIVVALVIAVAVGTATSSSNGYVVRAVFDNSSFMIAGEDVKIAGVKVGTVSAVQLTSQNQAAVVLQINAPKFVPFRADAHCEIGLESLLGEQFVQCTPTQPRAPGTAAPPALPAISSGPDKGQHLLPVQDTTAPIGIDLISDITRLPQQERLQLIISGLGVGLDSNGHELNAALLRADPALQQTDQVIAVLANQDRLLARLTDESDKILAPLAAQRAHVGGFIQHVGEVGVAAAQQGKAIEQNLQDFPPFLRQLKPAAQRLTALAESITPSLQVLRAQAPAINASLDGLGPLAKDSIPAFKTLGSVAQRGVSVFPQIHGVVSQLSKLGKPLLPVAADIAAVASSFDNAGGIEDVMRFIYYYTGTVNGEDAVSHYIRTSFEVSGCSSRSSTQGGGCGSTFATTTIRGSTAQATASAAREGLAVADRRAKSDDRTNAAKALLNYLLRS